MIKIILVPLDGTERSAEVLDTALILARRFEAHIKVVHVHEAGNESSFFTEMPTSLREEFVKMNRKMTEATIDTVREQFKSFCESNKIKVTRKEGSWPRLNSIYSSTYCQYTLLGVKLS